LPAAATNALLGSAIGVVLAAGDDFGDGAEDGLRFDVGVAGIPATVEVGAALGVAVVPDGTAAHAEPNRAITVNQRRIVANDRGELRRRRPLCR
jgi:hypothetical protein